MKTHQNAVRVFISYIGKDKRLLQQLETHLSLLRQQGLISTWYNQQIVPGTNRAETINEQLEQASIILLLISPDFLASDYCYHIEMKYALERHEAGQARVIPIAMRPADWKDAPFAHLQALPADAKAITTWRNQDKAFVDVVVGIRRAIKDLSLPPLSANLVGTAPPAIWYVPYHRNPFFTGREDLLDRLHECFWQAATVALTQPAAITGLGGIGKTQIAIEYAYRHKAAYHYIFWANASTRESLNGSFFTIAQGLALPTRNEQEQHLTFVAVQHWLATHDQWLLILDSADDATLVSEFLPTGDSGHVLLTTREPAWGPIAHSFEVREMSETEGILFLLRRAKILVSPNASLSEASDADQANAAKIVEEMKGLPLALDQAGAYVEEVPSTLDGYLKAYNRRRKQLLHKRGNEQRYHPDAVAATWSLNFKQIRQLDRTAVDLLYFLAFLGSDPIPEELIIAGGRELGLHLQAVADDETLLDQPLRVLNRFSLIRRNTETHLLFVHHLVQVVLIESMTDSVYRKWVKRAMQAVSLATSVMASNMSWEQCCERGYPTHAFECFAHYSTLKISMPPREGERYRCPCCRYKTLEERGRYNICPVCNWEDDGQDDENADVANFFNPNHMSLAQARENYRCFGAISERARNSVRPPLPQEL